MPRARWAEWQHQVMRYALHLASLGRGATHPNPAVGALVVKRGRVIGRGFHRRWGLPHAEVEALLDAGRASRGADLYVTLEPCRHHGKTPPCTDAIVKAGIKRVFAPMLDPNPLVNGKGVAALRRAGIPVEIGLEAEAALKLNEAYVKYMRTGRPFVTLKVAQTLDGKIATASGNARWITSQASRRLVRRLRGRAQALIIGQRTVEADDPELLSEPKRSRDYLRCILDSHLATPPGARILRTARRYPVVFYCARPEGRAPSAALAWRMRRLEDRGAQIVPVRTAPGGGLRLDDVLADLAARKVMHVWVEGGSAVFTSFLKLGLADKVVLFVAPKVMGGRESLGAFGDLGVKRPADCPGFSVDALEASGDDLVLTLYPAAQRERREGQGKRNKQIRRGKQAERGGARV